MNGRQIVFKYDDDGYNPAQHGQLTHKFVEQDHAFALVGGLGTEPQTGGAAVPERAARCRSSSSPPARRRSTATAAQVPVDDRLAARLRGRGRRSTASTSLKKLPNGEDRRHLPERRLRRGLSPRPEGRASARHMRRRSSSAQTYDVTSPTPASADREADGVGRRHVRASSRRRRRRSSRT